MTAGCRWMRASLAAVWIWTACGPREAEPPGRVTRGLDVRFEEQTYDISGDSPTDLANEMARRGPVVAGTRRHAATEFKIRWEYESVGEASRCRTRNVRVIVEMTTVLPRWKDRPDVADDRVLAWDAFRDALQRHEAGHRQLNRDGARRVLRAIEMTRSSTCAGLRQTLQRRTRNLVNEIHEDNRQYDVATDGGAVDGVVWPPRRAAFEDAANESPFAGIHARLPFAALRADRWSANPKHRSQ